MAYDTDYDPDLDATFDEAAFELEREDAANLASLEEHMTPTPTDKLLDVLTVLVYITGLLAVAAVVL